MQVKSAEGKWIEKVHDHVIACDSLKGKISQVEVVEDFESRAHKAVSFLVESEKEIKGVQRAEAAEGAALLQWRKVARQKHKKKRQRRRGATRGQRGKKQLGAKSLKKW